MRQANAIDNPQGSLSDADENEIKENDNDSIEEKQDSEPIDEKDQHRPLPAIGSQLTPEMARKDWSSRFTNIKSSFDTHSEEDPMKSRSPSLNRQNKDNERGRARTKSNPAPRSKSAQNQVFTPNFAKIDYGKTEYDKPRGKSKEDKNKFNTITAHSPNISSHDSKLSKTKTEHSGRDSAEYHQYLEMIERFRGNNPKVYSRPLQKNVPATLEPRKGLKPFKSQKAQAPQTNSQQNKFTSKADKKDTQAVRQVEHGQANNENHSINSLATETNYVNKPKEKHVSNSKGHDMDYQEYMNIIDKVRKTKEVARVRTEQYRLASMYAQEKKRQEELEKEEARIRKEKEQIKKEEAESRRSSITGSMFPIANIGPETNKDDFVQYHEPVKSSQFGKAIDPQALQFQRQLQIEQKEQQQQEQLRELQVKAEQERLAKLRKDQIQQEREREEIQRLEQERLLQIQEEQERLRLEQFEHEEKLRLEQQKLEEERHKQAKLQAEKNAIYNKQRLDMEAQHFAKKDIGAFVFDSSTAHFRSAQ